MYFIRSKQLWRILACLVAASVFITGVLPVCATETTTELENTTSGLESDLEGLHEDLTALNQELNSILSQIQKTSEELQNTREKLAVAKGLEKTQYDSMKSRIKYMYEKGNASMLEMLFSSSSMAEFINRAEYYSAITEYDRKLLSDFAKNSALIAEQEEKLIEDQKLLASLQNDLDAKERKLNEQISATSEELTTYQAKLEQAREDARRAEEEAKKDIDPVIPEVQRPSGGNSYETVWEDAISFTEEDVELLAALIECEAGTSHYEGMLAVGAVVVNRMKSRHYPDSLYGVIYQPGQFPPARSGKVAKIIKRGVRDSCKEAARDALNGKNNVGDCVSFRAASSSRPGTVIGDNVFF